VGRKIRVSQLISEAPSLERSTPCSGPCMRTRRPGSVIATDLPRSRSRAIAAPPVPFPQ